MDDDTRLVKVSKLEAAKRQLDCAIALWFTDGDEVSIYTLAAAAYQIISDLNRARKTAFENLYETSIIKPEYKERWKALVRDPVNFFKHADRDPDATHEFAVVGSMMFIVYAIVGLGFLQSYSSPMSGSCLSGFKSTSRISSCPQVGRCSQKPFQSSKLKGFGGCPRKSFLRL